MGNSFGSTEGLPFFLLKEPYSLPKPSTFDFPALDLLDSCLKAVPPIPDASVHRRHFLLKRRDGAGQVPDSCNQEIGA